MSRLHLRKWYESAKLPCGQRRRIKLFFDGQEKRLNLKNTRGLWITSCLSDGCFCFDVVGLVLQVTVGCSSLSPGAQSIKSWCYTRWRRSRESPRNAVNKCLFWEGGTISTKPDICCLEISARSVALSWADTADGNQAWNPQLARSPSVINFNALEKKEVCKVQGGQDCGGMQTRFFLNTASSMLWRSVGSWELLSSPPCSWMSSCIQVSFILDSKTNNNDNNLMTIG